jgi:hypothetical protein
VYIPVQIVEFPAAIILADRVIRITPLQVWRAASVPLIATFTMVVATLAVELALKRGAGLGDTLTLVACLLMAAVAYFGALIVQDRSIFHEARAVLLRGL